MEIWILILTLSSYNHSSIDHIEFNGKFACDSAKEAYVAQEYVEYEHAICVRKDNPPVAGPQMPLTCTGEMWPLCVRQMPGKENE